MLKITDVISLIIPEMEGLVKCTVFQTVLNVAHFGKRRVFYAYRTEYAYYCIYYTNIKSSILEYYPEAYTHTLRQFFSGTHSH